jgi:2-aminoadipate transaminase
VDGSRGKNAMRLNFSGSDEGQIREGIRRIGKVVSEQVALYETITGEHPALRGGAMDASRVARPAPLEEGAGDVLPFRHRDHS